MTSSSVPSLSSSSSSPPPPPASFPYFRSELHETTNDNGDKVINEWILGRRLGSGGFASVRSASHITNGYAAAIKRMSKAKLRQARALSKIRREIAIMSQLSHHNITPLWGVLEEDDGDQLCLVLQLQEKGTLMTWNGDTLRYTTNVFPQCSNGGIDEATLRPIFCGLVQALIYLRSVRVVHRDIKPDNILISSTGVAKLADFGVAHQFDIDHKMNGIVRDVAGTSHFFSPECCAAQTITLVAADDDELPAMDDLPSSSPPPPPSYGSEPPAADAATGPPYDGYTSDIWALGVTLYTCIFGQVPWLCSDGNRDTLFSRIQKEPLVIPTNCVISQSLRQLLHQMLEKDVKRRLPLEQLQNHEWFTSSSSSSAPAAAAPVATVTSPTTTPSI